MDLEKVVLQGSHIVLPDGLELYVEQHGEGEPVVLIPGWAYTADVFSRNISALAPRHRTICYDPRSHGRSPAIDRGHSYAQHGRDLHQLLQALKIDRVHIVGWSLGVYDALSYIEQYGLAKVQSIVLVDEAPCIVKEDSESWGEGSAEEIQGLINTVASEEYLTFFRDYMAAGFINEAPTELLDQFTQFASSLKPSQAAALLRDATRHNFQQLASEISQQIPLMQIVREEWADSARNWVTEHQPDAEFHILGGHLMLMEFHDDFNRLLLDFFGKSAL